jgi:hypothetical protein
MKPACLLLPLFLLLAAPGMATEPDPFLRGPESRHWKPVEDAVYLQEIGAQVPTQGPVHSVAVLDRVLYAGTDAGLQRLDGGTLRPAGGDTGAVHRVRVVRGALWVMAAKGLYRLEDGVPVRVAEGRYTDVAWVRGEVLAATGDQVQRWDGTGLQGIAPEGGFKSTNTTFHMEDGTQILPRPERFGPVSRIVEFSDTLYGLRGDELVLLDGATVDNRAAEWGLFPSPNLRDLLAVGNRLYVATDRGVAVLRGMALHTIDGDDGLPYEDTTCLARGFAEDLWIGTTWGAARQVGGEYQYFAGRRWLPHDRVHDIAVGADTVYIATEGGLGILRYEPYTLRKKAAYYERLMDEWGYKRLGFTHKLWKDPVTGEWTREITDNDGGFSAHYFVAMSYKYAATGDRQAREDAVRGFEAMKWLEEITPIEGFPARSIWSVADPGKRSEHGSGGLPARWVTTPDGNFAWKGDTSSDEVGVHYYATATFHDLAARGDEKAKAKEHLDRITRHIIGNGWKLVDMNGELTRWSRWDPEYLQRPYGMYARGLNGMEAQAYVTTAIALVGGDYFEAGLRQLIDWRYHEHTVRQKITFPPDDVTPWDDRLAFTSYYPLMKYATDPHLRSIYRRSLERSWEVKRIEEHPWFNFLYGAMTGNDCEAEVSVETLRAWPLDLVSYDFRNSHRADLHTKPGYTHYAPSPRHNSPKALSPRESEPRKLDATVLGLDGGSGGRMAITPNAWLEAYWMGRYYGFITPPATKDRALTEVEGGPLRQLGAKPYDGPTRADWSPEPR